MPNFERLSPILEGIAKQYPADSEEYEALRTAALAILWVEGRELNDEFRDFVQRNGEPLTDYQRAMLRDLGIDSNG